MRSSGQRGAPRDRPFPTVRVFWTGFLMYFPYVLLTDLLDAPFWVELPLALLFGFMTLAILRVVVPGRRSA